MEEDKLKKVENIAPDQVNPVKSVDMNQNVDKTKETVTDDAVKENKSELISMDMDITKSDEDKTIVSEKMNVPNNANIHDVSDKANICDNTNVSDVASLSEKDNVSDKANASEKDNVSDKTYISDKTNVSDKANVLDKANVPDEANISGKRQSLIITSNTAEGDTPKPAINTESGNRDLKVDIDDKEGNSAKVNLGNGEKNKSLISSNKETSPTVITKSPSEMDKVDINHSLDNVEEKRDRPKDTIDKEDKVEWDDMDTPMEITMDINTTTKGEEVSELQPDGGIQTSVESSEQVPEKTQGSTEALATMSKEDATTSALLASGCNFQQLPPLPKKVVRIFVSSTFTDTKEERNALMQHVYPKLADYCREKHGLEFQIVDMRWGVPEQASDNHTTSELCIQEISKCQQVSAGPNFVAIVGDKYGYRPIPSSIETAVFEALAATANTDWSLVQEWYHQDTNAIPPTHILQAISSKISNYNNAENAELRNKAWEEWKSVNDWLTLTLRQSAESAYNTGTISLQNKQQFFMSVTENEITSGVMSGQAKPTDSCYCIIRKIPDISQFLTEKNGSRFADLTSSNEIDNEAQNLLKDLRDNRLSSQVPESNLTKVDIEWSVSGASVSMEQFQDVDVAKYAQQMLKDKELVVYKHKEYLDNICSDFFKKICRLVQLGSVRQSELYDDLTTELLQHFHLAKLRCDIFEGREDLLQKAKDYLRGSDSTQPLVVYGNSGCGKTSVMAKVMEHVANGDWEDGGSIKKSYILVARFLGTTTKTSNVHQLLVTMCMQLARVFNHDWEEPDQITELVKSFYRLLEHASENRPILLLLDSIDQLMPVYNAYKLDWLPEEFPPHVKVVASTIDQGYSILDSFRDKYPGLECVEVTALGEKLGMNIICKWLSSDKRTMTSQQSDVIKAALLNCSLPLYARIAYDHIRKWKSYDIPTVDQLETTVKGAINKLYQYMEDKFGSAVVKHCLAYLTASRYGLSEAELEHILSLDDVLLNKVFRLWKPPVRRIPALIWTRIRSEVHSYIVERSADDTLVLFWYHRQFIETTKARYLQDPEFSTHIHNHLIQYFSGKWSSGAEKPFQYTAAQVKRFQLSSADSQADRKLPAQPYWTQHQALGETLTRYNKRKLSELPYHLLRNKEYVQLKQQTFFSYEWLYAKLKSTSVQQLLEEIDIFMQADKYLKKDMETRLLYVNLQLIRPYISKYPDSLSYELSGRLSKYIGIHPCITGLIKECDSIGNAHCPLLPLTSCFETAGLGFTQNIIYRNLEPWHNGGTFTCSSNFKFIYVIDYDEHGLPILMTWDIASGEKVNQVNIVKVKDESKKFTTDLYFQASMICDGMYLLACYKQRADDKFMKPMRPGEGFVDVIDIETGKVKATHDTFMYRDEFFDPLIYTTESFMCVSLGWKMPLINVETDTKTNFNRPTLLSSDEQYFIMCGKEQTVLREYETKAMIGAFDVNESQIGVTASRDFRTIAMIGGETKQIKIFDLINKNMKPKSSAHQLIKCKHVFKFDEKTAKMVSIIFKPILDTSDEGQVHEKTNNSVIMRMSPNSQHLMVVFLGWKWMAFLWTLWRPGRYTAKFVGPITPFRMPCTSRIPVFNYDGSVLVYAKKTKVLVVSVENVEVINEYEMKEDIKDICTSENSNKVVVMLQKRIMLLDILKTEQHTNRGRSKPAVIERTQVLLQREISNNIIHREVVYKVWEDNITLEQVDDLAVGLNMERITSATTRQKQALSKYTTPDGTRAIHYHRKVQVIDTKQELIKYTPKSGEHVARTTIAKDGETTNETLPIPGLDPEVNASTVIDLKPGDRVVNDSGKIKFRATKESDYKIMVVPSVITMYTTDELRLRKLQRITVYQETILDVSNSYIATAKSTGKGGHFVIVYNQTDGKLLAIHEMPSRCECARFSFDEIQLYAVDRTLTVKIFQAPLFTAMESQISLLEGEDISQIDSAFVVKDILHFPSNRECLLLKYGPEGPDVFVNVRYRWFNIITKEKSKGMVIEYGFDDYTSDGKFAIDTMLNVYDLEKGSVFTKVPYNRKVVKSERDRMVDVVINRRLRYQEMTAAIQLRGRITDNKYLVYINQQDNTLHLAIMRGKIVRNLASVFMHVTDILRDGGLTIRQNENIVLLQNPVTTVAFAINEKGVCDYAYQSQESRLLSIVKSINESQKGYVKLVEQQPKSVSIFSKRRALLQQIESESTAAKQKLKNSDGYKPDVLVLGESILCSNIFKQERFSPNLSTQKMNAQNASDALAKLKEDSKTYDVIIIQLITDDVPSNEALVVVKKVSLVVELAREKAKIVVISLAPCRADSKELNERTIEVNDKLALIYQSACSHGKHVHICKNDNMNDGGKPIPKYFKDGLQLSPVGLKRIGHNFKVVLAPLLGIHHI